MSSQQETDSSGFGEKLAYKSSNGDAWYLGQDPVTGLPAVRHVANPESGGHISFHEIDSFLSSGAGPEHQAIRHLYKPELLATILISYDIHPSRGAAYYELIEAIRSMGAWWHHLETVWIVRSDSTPEEIRDKLCGYVGADDQLLVLDITGARANWFGVSEAGSQWLEENIAGKDQVPAR
jgi:hypothetical protein